MNNEEKKELQMIVNPVYNTGKGTALLLALSGDEDAKSIIPHIGLEELEKYKNVKSGEKTSTEGMTNCYKIAVQARYGVNNKIAEQYNISNIVDLPSGYTPRGIRIAKTGRKYYGFDLPIVSDTMNDVVEKTISSELRSFVKYCAVDATNYESMKNALKDVTGEICILTEGLMGFFDDSELLNVCKAIYKLLSEYGGIWVTADAFIPRLYGATFRTILRENAEELLKVMHGDSARIVGVKTDQNKFFENDGNNAKKYLEDLGFTVKTESFSKHVSNISGIDSKALDELKQAYENVGVEVFIISVEKGKGEKKEDVSKDVPFMVKSSFADGKLSLNIQGRMDTITSPDVLAKFKAVTEKINSIEIDVEKMSYISSAGLRVLLMMYKSLSDKSGFKMLNVQQSVKEIMELTGFDTFLLG